MPKYLVQASYVGEGLKGLLKEGGAFLSVQGSADLEEDDLARLKDLIEAGKVAPVIDKRFPLSEVAEGMRWLENGRHRGKVVITM